MVRELKEVQGIVFKRKKYKETSILAKLLTKEEGIISVVANGALKPKSKLGAAVMNFSYGTYVLATNGQGLSNLRTYKSVKQYTSLYIDINKNANAAFILDLVDHAFLEYQDVGQYYNLVSLALDKIDSGINEAMITQIVQMQLLPAFGVAPQLKGCVICQKQKGIFDYSIELGGILCSDHFAGRPRLHLLPKQTAFIRTIGLVPLDRLGQIKVSQSMTKVTQGVIDQIYQETVDLNLKTKRFLDELRLSD